MNVIKSSKDPKWNGCQSSAEINHVERNLTIAFKHSIFDGILSLLMYIWICRTFQQVDFGEMFGRDNDAQYIIRTVVRISRNGPDALY